MEAKVELTIVWALGIWAILSGKDVAVVASICASSVVFIANLPKALETINKLKKKK